MIDRARSLRWVLAAAVFVSFVPVAAGLLFSASVERNREIREASDQLSVTAETVATNERRFFDEAAGYLAALSRFEGISDEDLGLRCDDQLRQAKLLQPWMSAVRLLTDGGEVACQDNFWVRLSAYPQSSAFTRAARDRVVTVSGLEVDPITGLNTITVFVPRQNARGVMAASVDLATISDGLNSYRRSQHQRVTLADAQRRVISSAPELPGWVGQQIKPDLIPLFGAELDSDEIFLQTGIDGKYRYFRSAPVGKTGLYVIASELQSEIVSDIETRMGWLLGALTVLCFVAATAAVALGDKYILKPLRQLTALVRAFEHGDLEARVVEFGRGETAELGKAFNRMAEAIQDRDAKLMLAGSSLRRGERMFKLLSESSGVMIECLDLELLRTYVSPACIDFLGYAPDELLDMSYDELVHAEDRAEAGRLMRSLQNGETDTVQIVQRVARSNGEWIWLGVHANLVRDEQGRPREIFTFARDITERQEQILAMAKAERRYRLLSENMADVICLCGLDGSREFVSPSVYRLLGFSPQEILEMPWQELVHPDDLSAVAEAFVSVSTDANPTSLTHRIRHKRGHWIWVETAVTQFTDTERPRCVFAIRDITERRAFEEGLEAAIAKAEEANRAKSDFLASMSHEVRSPLNGILGYSDLLLEDDNLSRSQRDRISHIQGAGRALLTVVNDILDLSKIEAGQIRIELEPFNIAELTESTVALVTPSAEAKGLDLSIEIAESVPVWVTGDKNRLRQVLLNLVNNAVKFTGHGSVRVLVSRSDDGEVSFTVQDTGIGISEENMPRLFQRFSQADSSIAREFGGTGLGLAICKSLVDLMGGSIGVVSKAGHGSTFRFKVPLPATSEPVLTEPAPVGGLREKGRYRVLAVDDLDVNLDIVASILRGGGFEVDTVDAGEKAVSACRAKCYDLVLMDIQMPGMDGLEATRLIRELSGEHGTVPIVAMTANVLPTHLERYKAAGMNGHVGKPFQRRDLYAAVARSIRDHDRPEEETPLEKAERKEPFEQSAFDAIVESIGADEMVNIIARVVEEIDEFLHADASDRARVRFTAHRMISAVSMIGFNELAAASSALEDAIDRQEPACEELERAKRAACEAKKYLTRWPDRLAA